MISEIVLEKTKMLYEQEFLSSVKRKRNMVFLQHVIKGTYEARKKVWIIIISSTQRFVGKSLFPFPLNSP